MDSIPQLEKPLPPEPVFSISSEMYELVMWRNARKTAVMFVSGLVVLVSMLYFSLISVLAYLALSVMAVTLGFRAYTFVMSMFNKTSQDHPFQDLLSVEICIDEESAHAFLSRALQCFNRTITSARSVLLVANVLQSLKSTAFLYMFTYIGAWFNTMTLIMLAYIAAFTVPKLYELNKQKVDEILAQICSKYQQLFSRGKTSEKED